MTNSHDTLAMVADIAAICTEPTAESERAKAVIDRLRSDIPFEAASLSMYDPADNVHTTVAGSDYPREVVSYLNDGFTVDDPAFLAMRFRHSRPLRWCDIPRYAETFSAREIFRPSGFREGVTTCLFTREGRYTGSLHLSTTFAVPLSDRAIDCLAVMRPVLGSLIDPLRTVSGPAWTELVETAVESALLTKREDLVPLPGLQGGPLLAPGGPLERQIRIASLLPGRHSSYTTVDGGRTVRIRLTPVASGHIVTVHDERPPRGLTVRELEVLGLLAQGLSNAEIGCELHLSHRTVATHVEHILEKLQCRSRVAAASIAAAEGIVTPPAG
ncbi:LuxR C-terminal-related transcriptional regulator [Prescottella defluvii]|nr:LuxR C-terminal-related transcriptional regulator [Prescottella defluvii]